MNEKQHALAAEIRAEMAAQRIKATDMQARTDIKHASWRNWFVTAARPVPYPELEKVCDVLGVPLSELLRRAEVRVASLEPADPVTAQLEAGLSKRARQGVAEARAQIERESGRGSRSQDPPVATGERTRRSA